MATNFSANQFEQQFDPKSLCNWEVPKWHQQVHPKARKNVTKIIANDRGHLLPGVVRANQQLESHHKQKINPWGNFKNTWQLPDKILTKREAFELSGVALQPSFNGPRWIRRTKNNDKNSKTKTKKSFLPQCTDKKQLNQSELNLEYLPGDLTDQNEQHSSRINLITDKLKSAEQKEREIDESRNDLYLEKHDCSDPIGQLEEEERRANNFIPHVLGQDILEQEEEMLKHFIPDKPTEREDSSPIIPAYCNFQMAKKMAQENLEHQPLPDAVMDRAYRKWQSTGALNPGLALEIEPVATGVGIKNYKAGPTQCTKMRVYRPKTCGITPKPVDKNKLFGSRPHTSVSSKKMGAMDLAICWDYRPLNPDDEPKRPVHIDGSNGSAAPAVFTLVKTPRTPEEPQNTGRTGGVFSSTLGEENFFDKDVLRRNIENIEKQDMGRKCECGNPENMWRRTPTRIKENPRCVDRPRSMTRDGKEFNSYQLQKNRFKSSPNLSEMAQKSEGSENKDRCQLVCIKHRSSADEQKKHHHHYRSQPNLARQKSEEKYYKTTRLCQRPVEPQIIEPKEYKSAFKAGIPNSNGSGTCTSFDSGCSSMSSNSICSLQQARQVKVPKPRDPYLRKNYNINTLAPPFACFKGGAGQGGYPEHWRLSSVYQHAYKPIDQRKRPLLATVYQ